MAGTQDWKVYILENLSGYAQGQWVVDDADLLRPNVSLGLEGVSTHTTIVLENGDKVTLQPTKKTHYSPVTLAWYDVEDTFKEQWEGYRDNGYTLKITTHNASNEFIGKISSVYPEWQAGVVSTSNGDLYNLVITFDRTNTV